MIAPMAAGGIIKGFLTILTTFGVLTSDNGIYLILYGSGRCADVLYAHHRRFLGRQGLWHESLYRCCHRRSDAVPEADCFRGRGGNAYLLRPQGHDAGLLPDPAAHPAGRLCGKLDRKGCEKDHPADAAIDVRADCGAGHHAAAHPAGGRPGHDRRFQCSGYRCQRAVQCGACGLRRCSGRVSGSCSS